jgi:hypothetical protein
MILKPRFPGRTPRPGHAVSSAFSQGLVLLQPFGEGGGSRILDPHSHNVGTYHGTTLSWQSSPIGPAVTLDGATNWVEVPADSSYLVNAANGSPFSVAAWVNWVADGTDAYGLIYGEEDGASFNLTFLIKSTGGIALYPAGGSIDPVTGVTLTSGLWYHLVWTFGLKYGQALYVNGIQKFEDGNFGGPTVGANLFRGRIGGNSVFGSGRFIQGAVAGVAKWVRELNPNEVSRLYVEPMSLYVPYRQIWGFTPGIGTIDGAGHGRPSSRAFGAGTIGHPGDLFIVGAGHSRVSSRKFGTGALAGGNKIIGSVGRPSSRKFGHGLIASANLIQGSYGRKSSRAFGVGALTTKEFTLFISGVDVTKHMRINSLNITNSISQTSTASFDYGGQDLTGALLILQVGQPVIFYHGNTRIFGGTIDQALNSFYGRSSTEGPNYIQVTCSDFSQILDRRYVAANYNQSGSVFDMISIVIDLVATYLSNDNIKYNFANGQNESIVNPGAITFDWITARQAFTQLANLVQWDFNVDYYGVLQFWPNTQGSGPAPFDIHDNDGNWLSEPPMTVQEFRTSYRNRQGVRSASQSSALWTDTFSTADPGPFPVEPQPPDGIRRAFITKFGIPTTPYVFVNGSAQRVVSLLDIGAAGPGGYDWYWIPPQGFAPASGVFQNQANPVLTSSDVLTVQYQSPVSPIIFVECADQIAIRAAIEGNSGIYEDVQNVQNITDPGALTAYAQGLLNRYGCLYGMPKQVIYTTDKAGLFAGMLQTIQTTNPFNQGSAPYMLSQVQIRDKDGKFLRYTVTADSGLYQLSSAQYLGQLVNQGQLAQPSNRNTYVWQLAPSYPGITNPGLSSGQLAQIQATLATSEVPLYMTIIYQTAPSTLGPNVEIEINGAGFGQQLTLPLTPNRTYTVYFPTQAFPQGSSLVPLFQGGNSGIKDGVLTLVTSVIRN